MTTLSKESSKKQRYNTCCSSPLKRKDLFNDEELDALLSDLIMSVTPHPNVITMFKKGQTKLPINRVAQLAKALEVDPVYLLRLVMLEYMSDSWEQIENIMQSTILTANELELVRTYRKCTGDNDSRAVVIDRDALIAIVAA